MLRIEHKGGRAERNFFHNGRQYEGAETLDVASDQQKRELPGDGYANKSIELLGMSERGRELSAQGVFHEVLRDEHRQAINTSNEKDSAGELSIFRRRATSL